VRVLVVGILGWFVVGEDVNHLTEWKKRNGDCEGFGLRERCRLGGGGGEKLE
jgi:hypothetical protein